MPDNSKLLAFISRCNDPKALKEMLRKAREQGAKELEDAAFTQLIGLVPGERPGTLEYDFWRMVHAFETMRSLEAGKTVQLSRTRQKVGRVGVVETLSDWALVRKETQGFRMLMDRDLPELTGEAIILRHADRFSRQTVGGARFRLMSEGVSDKMVIWPLGEKYRCADDKPETDLSQHVGFQLD